MKLIKQNNGSNSKVYITLSLFVSIQVSDSYVKVSPIIVFFSLKFSFLDIFLFLKISVP
jgi:hypothetical protein